MRITDVMCVLSLLSFAGCSKADAAVVDPNNDYDCSVASEFFREMARLQHSPDRQRRSIYIVNQWFAAKWQHDHPGSAEPKDRGLALINAMSKNPDAYKDALMTCVDRATADPHFNRFASLVAERTPDAR